MSEITFKCANGITKRWVVMKNGFRFARIDRTGNSKKTWVVTLTLQSENPGIVGSYPLLRDAKAAAVAALGDKP